MERRQPKAIVRVVPTSHRRIQAGVLFRAAWVPFSCSSKAVHRVRPGRSGALQAGQVARGAEQER